jgi:hypothetical protein
MMLATEPQVPPDLRDLRGHILLPTRSPGFMRKPTSGVADKGISRILELSADAHIERRATARGTETFHNLTGQIAAYGKALEILADLQQAEEFFALIEQYIQSGAMSEKQHKANPYVA